MSVLPEALAGRLGERIVCGAPLVEVTSIPRGYRLTVGTGQVYDCDALVMATQAADACKPLRPLDAELARLLEQFEYAPVAVVGLGFPRAAVAHSLDGFGFLVPGQEGRRLLGSLWTSSIFTQRAPAGSVLLRTLIGGARAPALVSLSEDALVQLAREELLAILGISAEPSFVQVFKWPKAICQYNVGHSDRLDAIDARVARLPGLFLTGNSYRGVALNDCTRNAVIVADAVVSFLRPGPDARQAR
jgi:oxygen-dependent protoporphyrinogen oxidase